MNKIKILFTIALMLLICTSMQAQFGKALGKAIENAAKNATVRKAEQKTDQAVSKSIDKATSPDTYKGDDKDGGKGSSKNSNSKSGAEDENSSGATGKNGSAPQGVKAAEMAYAKNDFVPGDEIIFDDPMDNEKVGEFPSQWDLLRGNSEVVVVNGKKGFELSGNQDAVCPLMKNPKNYLGDVFTVEFDFLSVKAKNQNTALWYTFCFLKPDEIMGNYGVMYFTKAGSLGRDDYRYRWQSNNGSTSGDADLKMEPDVWHHIAISFNKRAWKMYINGVRIINVPNVSTPPGWMCILMDNVGEGSFVFTNFRIAKGAVPLYDRLASEGKIITYGITFDVGKSTIKPESMTEINRIATLMKENPDLKFSVEGHTDNTGNAASNQTLSEARSQAVVDKLVELGIAKDRLKAAGKGQTSPISDNSTDEGRAKNRRVEFVKIN